MYCQYGFIPLFFFIIRWKSLHFMLKRLDKVKNCILKSLIDLGSSISFDEEELNMIHNLVTLLKPVKLAVEALCRRDATLLSAETTISFMINNFGNSDLAVQLKESLSRRMNQRRTQVSSLLQYLHKGNQTYAELELDPKF
jgi:ADP-dependent phosphofructokinase/glucokinase